MLLPDDNAAPGTAIPGLAQPGAPLSFTSSPGLEVAVISARQPWTVTAARNG